MEEVLQFGAPAGASKVSSTTLKWTVFVLSIEAGHLAGSNGPAWPSRSPTGKRRQKRIVVILIGLWGFDMALRWDHKKQSAVKINSINLHLEFDGKSSAGTEESVREAARRGNSPAALRWPVVAVLPPSARRCWCGRRRHCPNPGDSWKTEAGKPLRVDRA